MNLALDLARVLAALCIFYYHAGIFLPLPLSNEGEYAVSTFILLAVASAVAFSLPKRTGLQPAGLYLSRRITRLMPLYLFVNVCVFGISQVIPSKIGRPFTAGEFALSSLGISQYFHHRYMSEVFWFLPFILQVYLLLSILYPWLSQIPWRAMLPLSFLVTWAMSSMLPGSDESVREIMRNWSPLFRLPETIFGIMAGLWIVGRMSTQRFLWNLLAYSMFSALFVLGVNRHSGLGYIFFLPLKGLTVTLVTVAASAGIAAMLSGAALGMFRVLGRATYPFFLIHGLGMATLHRRFGTAPFWWSAYFILCVLGALALDWMFARPRFPWTTDAKADVSSAKQTA